MPCGLNNAIAFFHSYFPLFTELKENVRQLEEWFKEAEDVLREPLKFNQKWTRKAIDAKMQEIQVGGSKHLFPKEIVFLLLSYSGDNSCFNKALFMQ